MKILAALAGSLLLAGFCFGVQAQQSSGSSDSLQSGGSKARKAHDGAEALAEVEKHLQEREAELKKATEKGRTDIAGALKKLIADLNNMKTALNNKDEAAFKTANEQRKKDREALEALRKADKEKAESSGKQLDK